MKIAFLALLVFAPMLAAQTSHTFGGTGTGAIPDGAGAPPPQSGGFMFVSFNVSGITEPITGVELLLTMNHTYLGDVRVVLGGPASTSAVVFARVGALTSTSSGSDASLNGTYLFGDSGPLNMWTVAAANSGGVMPSGVSASNMYRASTEGGSGSGGALVNLTAAFSGLSVGQINDLWDLIVDDVHQGDTGSITGATLILITGSASGGGGGGKKKSGGCSTDESPRGAWWYLLAVAVGLAGFSRALRSRAE